MTNNPTRNLFVIFVLSIFLIAADRASGQQLLINEIEIDPPSTTSDACQYAEIRGQAGAAVPANTYFLSVNSDGGNFGFASQAVGIGGQNVGANGTITLINNFSGPCPNRVYPAGTTQVVFASPLFIGQGSETYLLVQSTAALISGQDLDTDDDGAFDANFGITVLDGFALLVNPDEEYVYGAATGVVNISNTTSLDQPDAVTRFGSNVTPFTAAAFYFGELAAAPDETTTYAAPFSPNFPQGGALTPGAPNGGPPANDAPVDFDGDGKTDFVVVRAAGGVGTPLTWFTAINGGGPIGTTTWGVNGDVILAGDYDGDGRDDASVWRSSNATFYIIQSGNFTIRVEQFGAAGDNPRIVGDYNGDGRDDLAVYRPGGQGVWFYKTSPTALFERVEWGENDDAPAPGDYDGDGKADFVVHRNEGPDGRFYKRLSSGTFDFQFFGSSNDTVVPGDYDGDGRTDMAVVRTTGGVYVWDIDPSGTPGSQVIRANWGVPGDITAQGDYDGDGSTDYAVWRPGNPGTFYMMTFAARSISTSRWGQTGDVPVAGYNTF
ncbi:MAG: VCBS repeat-containing protein [Chloracidobacterium sp.]|nr:VCBS repeat-containing protein [Chloracidobacterium sp.]